MNYSRGRGSGRSYIRGCGRGRYHGRRKYDSIRISTTNQEKELKSFPQVQGKSSYATYSTVKEYIVKKVQNIYKGGQDIAKSLEYLQPIYLQTTETTRALYTKATPKEQEI